MKKAILISMLFLLSCGYESQNNIEPNIVQETGISDYGKGWCYYRCSGSVAGALIQILGSKSFLFYDSCGKYRVGDTIHITKK